MKKLKIALHSPYIPDHFGGGEKYMFDVALSLAAAGHQVIMAVSGQKVPSPELIKQYQTFLGRDLSQLSWQACPIGTSASWWEKLWWTKQFDVIFAVTDGSLWWSLARHNILHLQIPFTFSKSSPIDRWKLANWPIRVANSVFTQQIVAQAWRTPIQWVLHPQIELPAKPPVSQRAKVILGVGRFFQQLHTKRQDVLVAMFRQLRAEHASAAKGWKLVLIGRVEDEGYARAIAEAAADLPVEIHHSVSRSELVKWYQTAQIFWHAAGYEIDEKTEPTKVEHFGIATAEAMAYGVVPVVHGKGGQREVLGPDLESFAWQTPAEAVTQTAQLMTDQASWRQASQQAQTRAAMFGPAQYEATLKQIMESLHD